MGILVLWLISISFGLKTAVGLRSALEARTAEASLYKHDYEALCRKLDKMDAAFRQLSARDKAQVSSPLLYLRRYDISLPPLCYLPVPTLSLCKLNIGNV